jgi:MerR family transcriptional regulator, light-induced transcriptional regulator
MGSAQAVLGEDNGVRVSPIPSTASELSGDLRTALDAFDEPAAQAALDRLVSDLSLTTVLRDVVLPFLAELGQRWEHGTVSVAQEHFASNVIRGRLAGLAPGLGERARPARRPGLPAGRAP